MGVLKKAKSAIQKAIPKSFGEETLKKVEKTSNDNVKDEKTKSKIQEDLDTTFSIDDNGYDFFDDKQGQVDSRKQNENFKDILEVLNIPEQSVFTTDVLNDEDLKNIDFDQETPVGYDIGQVNSFIERVSYSIRNYLDKIIQRDKDVAQLATTIDRLEVDLNNLKYEMESANGINIVPTQQDAEIENELMKTKVRLRQAMEKLAEYKKKGKNSKDTTKENIRYKEKIQELNDELSLKNREIESLKESIEEYKRNVALLDDDTSVLSDVMKSTHKEKDEGSDYSDEEMDDDFSYDDDESSIIETVDDNGDTSPVNKNKIYDDEDDDENDPVINMMKNWNNEDDS